ncbi:MAG: metallophosphoesterase [Vicinamibacterales bacterium]
MAAAATRCLIAVLLLCVPVADGHARTVQEPAESLRFAVIGDFGTATKQQYELANVMAGVRDRSPFGMVLTVGDNIYAAWSRRAVVDRFETPYRALLDAGVTFFASLGNHDSVEERSYPLFNMGGARYYTVTRSNVQLFALDSNYLDPAQLTWLRQELETSTAPWKIAIFHHPLYSSAQRHGASEELRVALEPLFVQYGVQVVFSGHDHVYERFKPQHGITYFVCGSGGQLRRGNLGDALSPQTAAGFDLDLVFVAVQIDGDVMRFQAISRTGAVVDSGVIQRVATP